MTKNQKIVILINEKFPSFKNKVILERDKLERYFEIRNLDLFSNLKIHQRNKKPTTKKPPLTPPKPPLTPPKEGNKKMPPKEANKKIPPREANKKMPPREANNSPPSEGLGVVSYRLSKKSIKV
ncbi:MAG: hypothetical protein LBC74_13515 [Planctomycetaceae bacterium]|nr:hypothetical protein [Planctomycetaceae bacterium]